MSAEAPATLGAAGQTVWAAITGKYELRADELVTLEDVCVFSDEIADLTAEWVSEGKPRTTKGSMGQLVEHPHPKRLADLRMKRNALWRQLKLPDDGAASGAAPAEDASSKARRAAAARWAGGA